MVAKAYMFGKALMRLGGEFSVGGSIDFEENTFTVALLKASYPLTVSTLANQEFVDEGTPWDSAHNEVSTGLGYARKNFSLPTWTFVPGNGGDPSNIARFDDAGGAPTQFNNFTGTFQYAVLFKNTGTDTTSPVISLIDFQEEISVISANFIVAWPAAGVLRFRTIQESTLPPEILLGSTFPITFPFTMPSNI